MRILLFGHRGQVGWELARCLGPLGEVTAPGRESIDLANADAVRAAVRRVRPDVIVNAAAWTAVDAAETDEPAAHAINAVAPATMAEEARALDALLIHYSTDYVHDGSLDRPWREVDPVAPLSAYGRTKLAGEIAVRERCPRHLILRTSWVFAARGANFVRTMLRLADAQPELRVVADQTGAPTYARHIAAATAAMIAKGASRHGTFNLTAAGATTWHGFASEIMRRSGRSVPVIPVGTEAFPRPARRPANSRLDGTALRDAYGLALPAWETGLQLCLEELGMARPGS